MPAVITSKIKNLLSPSRKRKRDNEKDEELTKRKKVRRSTRVRFQPLKYWENERICADPTIPLTMKDIEEKGDALLVPSPSQQVQAENARLKPIRKKIPNESNEDDNNKVAVAIDVESKSSCSEYQCEPWTEYKNDSYYDPQTFNGLAWILDDEEPMIRAPNIENGKLENDDDDEDEEEEFDRLPVQKVIVSLPSNVKMRQIGKVYGGITLERKEWKSLFLEIPPQGILDKDEATHTSLFFVHRAQARGLEFTLFAKQRDDEEERKKTFILGEGAQFYVPKGHWYELKNLSMKRRVHLAVTQFGISETL